MDNLNERTYDEVVDEQSPEKRQEYWDVAFGLQAVDGLEPSKYMVELSEQHVRGEKTYRQVQSEITSYYNENASNNREKEADEVSAAIYDILNNKSFRFDYLTLKSYHKHLFSNLDPKIYNPGEFRTYNITKSEPILDGDTMMYQAFDMLEESLKYDFEEEQKQDYANFSEAQIIERICEFTSRIWQVHPFQEGNTRTVAVFIEKYLNSMGFQVDNEPFEKNSLYFRNALVRANYTNVEKKIKADKQFLVKFFENLLLGKQNQLSNEDCQINVG